MRGFGKSYMTKQLARGAERVLVLDPHYDYEPEDLGAGALVCDALHELPDLLASEKFRVIFRPEEELEDFDLIFRLIFHLKNLLVVVDEVEEWYRLGDIPRSFRRTVARSRKRGISIFLTGHRVTELPTKFRSLAELWVFRTQYQADLEVYARLGASAEALERIPKLPVGEFVIVPHKEAAA